MTRTPSAPPATAGVVVVEPAPSDRIRRPGDLVTLILALMVLVLAVGLGTVAVGTANGLEQDLVGAGGALPRPLLQLMGWAGGLGLLLLLIVDGVVLVVRSRSWQLFEAITAAAAGALLALLSQRLILDGHFGAMLAALTKGLPEGGRTTPLEGLLVAGIAFFTVTGVGKRQQLRIAAFVIVGSAMLFGFLSGEVTALALLVTALLGWIVGLAALFAIGAASTRTPGTAVAAALIGCGLDITRLELVGSTGVRGRQYSGSGPVGSLDVRVLERDTFGTEAGRRVLRRVRLRGPSTRGPSLTIRGAVEHHALMALAVARAGVRAPELLATAEVGPFAAVLAYRRPTGVTLAPERVEGHTGGASIGEDCGERPHLGSREQLWRPHARLGHRQRHQGVVLDRATDGERGTTGGRSPQPHPAQHAAARFGAEGVALQDANIQGPHGA